MGIPTKELAPARSPYTEAHTMAPSPSPCTTPKTQALGSNLMLHQTFESSNRNVTETNIGNRNKVRSRGKPERTGREKTLHP